MLPSSSFFLYPLRDFQLAFLDPGSFDHQVGGLFDGQQPGVQDQVVLSEEAALSLARKAVEYACKLGDTVIVGRGGQVILRDEPNVLHVRVVAPLEDRILRVRGDPRAPNQPFERLIETRRAAHEKIAASDAISADYLKRLYGVDWDDPSFYHLILNTGLRTIEQAADLVIEAARIQERKLVVA